MADPLVLINTFEVSRDYAERLIAAWGEDAGLPFRSAWLCGHRAASGGHPQCGLPVRQHRSLADRRGLPAATQSPGFRESAAGLAGYQPHPGLYRVVRT
jgi:hypothetical protein